MAADYNVTVEIDSRQAKKGSDAVIVYLDDIRKKANLNKDDVEKSLDFDTRSSKRSLDGVESSISDINQESKKLDSTSKSTFNTMRSSADDARSSFNNMRGVILGTVASVGALVGGVTAFMRSSSSFADDIVNQAGVSGTAASEFNRMAFAASTVGIEQRKLSNILRDTQRRIVEFNRTGSGPLIGLFEELGEGSDVLANKLANLSGRDALLELVVQMENAGMSSAQMNEQLGKISPEIALLIPLLKDGAAGLKEVEERTASISDQEFQSLAELNFELDLLSKNLKTVSNQVASEFSEEFTTGITTFSDKITEASNRLITMKTLTQDADTLTLEQSKRELQELEDLIERTSEFSVTGISERIIRNLDIGPLKSAYEFFGLELISVQDAQDRISSNVDHINTLYDKNKDKIVDASGSLKLMESLVGNIDNNVISLNSNMSNFASNLNSSAIEVANMMQQMVKNETLFQERTSYETGLSIDKLSEIRSKIKENDLYRFYDNEQQKIKAYIKDNDLLAKSNTRVVATRDKVAEQSKSIRDALDSEISSLQFQIDTYEMSESQVISFRKEQGDLAEAIKILGSEGEIAANKLIELTNAMSNKDAANSISNEVKSLNQQLQLLRANSEMERISLQVGFEFEDEANQIGIESLREIEQIKKDIYLENTANSFISEVTEEIDVLNDKIKELESVRHLLTPEIYDQNMEKLKTQIQDIKIETDDYLSFMRDMGEEIRGTFSDIIFNGLEGDWSNMFDNLKTTMNRKVADILADQALNQLMNMFSGGLGGGTSVGGGLGSFISGLLPGRASGGWMHPNKVYKINERGDEAIRPDRNMYVENSNGSSRGKSTDLNINLNGNINASNEKEFREARSKIQADLARTINNAKARGDI